jgi:hypothetical protein
MRPALHFPLETLEFISETMLRAILADSTEAEE